MNGFTLELNGYRPESTASKLCGPFEIFHKFVREGGIHADVIKDRPIHLQVIVDLVD
jgi:hypothetical protein